MKVESIEYSPISRITDAPWCNIIFHDPMKLYDPQVTSHTRCDTFERTWNGQEIRYIATQSRGENDRLVTRVEVITPIDELPKDGLLYWAHSWLYIIATSFMVSAVDFKATTA